VQLMVYELNLYVRLLQRLSETYFYLVRLKSDLWVGLITTGGSGGGLTYTTTGFGKMLGWFWFLSSRVRFVKFYWDSNNSFNKLLANLASMYY